MIVLSGNQANITPLTVGVSALTNNGSGAVRVTTSSPHEFATGDLVLMNTPVVAGSFYITVIDATHFDLVGSTYTSTSTGNVTDQSLTPQIQVPTDGDTGSLQLSGFVSAFQGVMDRTQYLRALMAFRALGLVSTFAGGTYAIPAGSTHMFCVGCGSGGSGGGGCGGWSGTSQGSSGGSGGAGAPLCMGFFPVSGNTAIDVVIGASPAGGLGGAAGATPIAGGAGVDGHASTVSYHGAGTQFFLAPGGAGGGGGQPTPDSSGGSTVVWTPGGRGLRGGQRSAPLTQTAPGPAQAINLFNSGSAITPSSGAWPTAVFTDPRGPMDPGEGGASVQNGNGTYSAALSYAGMPDQNGTGGGNAGSNGTASGAYPGGAGGGGGGGGGFPGTGGFSGGAGGNGGNANNAGTAGSGSAGSAANGDGGGGGGGGQGGNGTTGGPGGNGGVGGAGFVYVLFLTVPSTP